MSVMGVNVNTNKTRSKHQYELQYYALRLPLGIVHSAVMIHSAVMVLMRLLRPWLLSERLFLATPEATEDVQEPVCAKIKLQHRAMKQFHLGQYRSGFMNYLTSSASQQFPSCAPLNTTKELELDFSRYLEAEKIELLLYV